MRKRARTERSYSSIPRSTASKMYNFEIQIKSALPSVYGLARHKHFIFRSVQTTQDFLREGSCL